MPAPSHRDRVTAPTYLEAVALEALAHIPAHDFTSAVELAFGLVPAPPRLASAAPSLVELARVRSTTATMLRAERLG